MITSDNEADDMSFFETLKFCLIFLSDVVDEFFFCIKELRYFNQLSMFSDTFLYKKTRIFKQVEQFSLMNTNENDWCHSLSFDDLFSPFWFKIQTYYSRTQSSIIPVHVCKSIWLIIFYVCVYENLSYLIKKKKIIEC